jgi:hypothetical protein
MDVVGRAAVRGHRAAGQVEDVVALVTAEPQRPGKRRQHLLGRLGPSPALKLDVVIDRGTGQLRHLITAQPGHPTPRADRQADIPRPDPVPARLEESSQFDEIHPTNVPRSRVA